MAGTRQLGSPERFAVTVVPVSGEPMVYTVTTWLHQLKAVALAAAAHEKRHDHDGGHRLYDVQVEALGPAAVPGADDRVDRMEW